MTCLEAIYLRQEELLEEVSVLWDEGVVVGVVEPGQHEG